MALLKIVLSMALVASCYASGLPHHHLLPAVRAPIVRYAPFYNFPSVVRSIHAISPAFPAALPVARTPLAAPAPLFSPFAPAPVVPRALPVPFSPIVRAAPVFPAPVLPAPVLPAPTFPAFASAPALPAPVLPAYPGLPAYAGWPGFNPALSAPSIALARALPHYARLAPAPLLPAPTPLLRQGW